MTRKALGFINKSCFCLFFLLITSVAYAETAFTWTDDKGIIHYSDRNPKFGGEVDEKLIKKINIDNKVTNQFYEEPVDESPKQFEQNNVEHKTKSPVNKENCQRLAKTLNDLTTNARVRFKNEAGELEYLSPKEHQEQIQIIQKRLEKEC